MIDSFCESTFFRQIQKTILREGNQLVAELDFPVAEFVEALVTSTGSVPYMT